MCYDFLNPRSISCFIGGNTLSLPLSKAEEEMRRSSLFENESFRTKNICSGAPWLHLPVDPYFDTSVRRRSACQSALGYLLACLVFSVHSWYQSSHHLVHLSEWKLTSHLLKVSLAWNVLFCKQNVTREEINKFSYVLFCQKSRKEKMFMSYDKMPSSAAVTSLFKILICAYFVKLSVLLSSQRRGEEFCAWNESSWVVFFYVLILSSTYCHW